VPANVAVVGDVQASPAPGTNAPSENVEAGTWQAGPISYQSYNKLTIGGQPVIYEASCTFNYTGGKDVSSGSEVPPIPEIVTLTATLKKTQKGSNYVLVDGDSESGPNGNELSVNTSNKLRTD